MPDDKECFVISPIGEKESETRERADKLFDHIIKDTVEDLGYEAVRPDKSDEPGQITHQVIQHTVNAELVVADLTGKNPNVLYELAIRHASEEPFIQIIEKGNDIPFDVYDQRTIKVDIGDLDSVDECVNKIENQIENIESGDFEVDSPVTTAANLQFWENSEDPQQQELADITEEISDIRNEMSKLSTEIRNVRKNESISDERAQKISAIRSQSMMIKENLSQLEDMIDTTDFKIFDASDENSVGAMHDYEERLEAIRSSTDDITGLSTSLLSR